MSAIKSLSEVLDLIDLHKKQNEEHDLSLLRSSFFLLQEHKILLDALHDIEDLVQSALISIGVDDA